MKLAEVNKQRTRGKKHVNHVREIVTKCLLASIAGMGCISISLSSPQWLPYTQNFNCTIADHVLSVWY
jgi:hypothetical protein